MTRKKPPWRRRPHQIPKEERLEIRRGMLNILESAASSGITALEISNLLDNKSPSAAVLCVLELIELRNRGYVFSTTEYNEADRKYFLTQRYHEDKQIALHSKNL